MILGMSEALYTEIVKVYYNNNLHYYNNLLCASPVVIVLPGFYFRHISHLKGWPHKVGQVDKVWFLHTVRQAYFRPKTSSVN